MRSLLHDQLDPRARLIKGGGKRMGMLEGLDASFDAALCVGYHSRAGALGVMSHSFMGHERPRNGTAASRPSRSRTSGTGSPPNSSRRPLPAR